jgi:hypothetical protein
MVKIIRNLGYKGSEKKLIADKVTQRWKDRKITQSQINKQDCKEINLDLESEIIQCLSGNYPSQKYPGARHNIIKHIFAITDLSKERRRIEVYTHFSKPEKIEELAKKYSLKDVDNRRCYSVEFININQSYKGSLMYPQKGVYILCDLKGEFIPPKNLKRNQSLSEEKIRQYTYQKLFMDGVPSSDVIDIATDFLITLGFEKNQSHPLSNRDNGKKDYIWNHNSGLGDSFEIGWRMYNRFQKHWVPGVAMKKPKY